MFFERELDVARLRHRVRRGQRVVPQRRRRGVPTRRFGVRTVAGVGAAFREALDAVEAERGVQHRVRGDGVFGFGFAALFSRRLLEDLGVELALILRVGVRVGSRGRRRARGVSRHDVVAHALPEGFEPGVQRGVVPRRVLIVPEAEVGDGSRAQPEEALVQALRHDVVLAVVRVAEAEAREREAREGVRGEVLAQEEAPERADVRGGVALAHRARDEHRAPGARERGHVVRIHRAHRRGVRTPRRLASDALGHVVRVARLGAVQHEQRGPRSAGADHRAGGGRAMSELPRATRRSRARKVPTTGGARRSDEKQRDSSPPAYSFFDTVYRGNGGDCTPISNQFHRQTIAHFLRKIFSIGQA